MAWVLVASSFEALWLQLVVPRVHARAMSPAQARCCFFISMYLIDDYFFAERSLMRWGLGMRSMASMVCTHVMPRLRMAALWPTCVFGNRPFFFNKILTARKTMLAATIISVNSNVFHIFCVYLWCKDKR